VKVTFDGQIKSLTSRVLATGDKGGRMVIEFNIYADRQIGELAEFVTVDEEIKITLEKK
jgi:hypothetical protein